MVQNISPEYRDLGQNWRPANGIRVELSSKDSTLCSSVKKFKHLLLRLGETPENFTRIIIFMSMFHDISWWMKRQWKRMRCQMLNLVSLYAKKFGTGQWSFLGLGSEKKWYSISYCRLSTKWMGQNGGEGWCWNSQKADTQSSVLQVHCPEVNSREAKVGGKLSIHCCVDLETIITVFRTIISVNQLSLYGAVADMCQEYETLHDRTGKPVCGKDSRVPHSCQAWSRQKCLLDCDDLARKDILLQQIWRTNWKAITTR